MESNTDSERYPMGDLPVFPVVISVSLYII